MKELAELDGAPDLLMKKRADLRTACIERDIQRVRSEIKALESRVTELEVEKLKATMLVDAFEELTTNGSAAEAQIKVEDRRRDVGEEMGKGKARTTAEEDEDEERYVSDVEASSAIDHLETRDQVMARAFDRLCNMLGDDFDL